MATGDTATRSVLRIIRWVVFCVLLVVFIMFVIIAFGGHVG